MFNRGVAVSSYYTDLTIILCFEICLCGLKNGPRQYDSSLLDKPSFVFCNKADIKGIKGLILSAIYFRLCVLCSQVLRLREGGWRKQQKDMA